MKKFVYVLLGAVLLPAFAHAQYVAGGPGVRDLINIGRDLLNWVLPIMVTIAVAILFFNVLKYVLWGNNDAKAKAEGLKGIIYSIVAIFIMLAIWGIIALLSSTTGIGVGGQINSDLIPSVPNDQF